MRPACVLLLALFLAGCDGGGDLALEPMLPIREEDLLRLKEMGDVLAQIKTKDDIPQMRWQLRKVGARARRVDEYVAKIPPAEMQALKDHPASAEFQKQVNAASARHQAEQDRIAKTLGNETMAEIYAIVRETQYPQKK